jgi:hypothetical protein
VITITDSDIGRTFVSELNQCYYVVNEVYAYYALVTYGENMQTYSSLELGDCDWVEDIMIIDEPVNALEVSLYYEPTGHYKPTPAKRSHNQCTIVRNTANGETFRVCRDHKVEVDNEGYEV